MRICMVQSTSSNIEKLFKLTICNHIKYCNKHNYSFLIENEEYHPTMDFEKYKNILKNYDLVFTLGTDCLITNLDKKIEDFLDPNYNIAICKEGNLFTLVNGEILFFWNNPKTFEILDYIQERQKTENESSTQAVINNIFFEKNDICKNIQLIEAGTLQKYFFEKQDYLNRKALQKRIPNDKEFAALLQKSANLKTLWFEETKDPDFMIWKDKNDFCLHTLGLPGIPLEMKYNIICAVLKKYPELINFTN